MDDLIRITPDKERSKSLLGMISVRLDSIYLMETKDISKFASKIIEEYYECIIELITAIMSVDGFKTRSDLTGAHLAGMLARNTSRTEKNQLKI